ncbi:hypothetical protein QIH01_19870 [Brevibacillus brevis]|nr:hypothetical protein QIH01_19870 [Brevibacillus brevis]
MNFTEPKQIEKHTITARSYRDDMIKEWPKDWTFEGYDQNLSEWIILDKLLVIKMISDLEKEFELPSSEVQDFIDWYNSRADGRGKETYIFDKDFNKGPFTFRKDYVAFSKIQSFEVMEYTK